LLDDLFLAISRPGLALRSAIVPVPGLSRFDTLGTREAEDEAVVGSTGDIENDLLARVTTGSGLAMGSTWA
jgi:hypothetical protein